MVERPDYSMSTALPPFRKLDETEVLRGSLIQVATGRFEAPDGEQFERDIVHHPGAVVVVPLTEVGTVLMVRQFRAAVGAELLELPAGKRDVDGEPTEVTAGRELAEEVGRQAGRYRLLARFYNSPGFTDELSWLYLAEDLTPVPYDRQGSEERHMTVEEISLAAVPGMIQAGDIIDAKSIIGLTMAASASATGPGDRRRARGSRASFG
jgi:8-oxo-dGTP pyrophosphatase MutT (NUDIX family)